MRLQTDDYSCGPVAIYNAYYYKYNCFPNITLKKLCNRCLTNEQTGTERWYMNQIRKRWDINNSKLEIVKRVFANNVETDQKPQV